MVPPHPSFPGGLRGSPRPGSRPVPGTGGRTMAAAPHARPRPPAPGPEGSADPREAPGFYLPALTPFAIRAGGWRARGDRGDRQTGVAAGLRAAVVGREFAAGLGTGGSAKIVPLQWDVRGPCRESGEGCCVSGPPRLSWLLGEALPPS